MIRCFPKWFSAGYCMVLLLLMMPASAPAQSNPGDTMIDKYLAQETAKISSRFLDLVNATDKAFNKTAQIYKLAGAEDKLRRQ